MQQHAEAQRYLIHIDLAEVVAQNNARVDLSRLQRRLDRTGTALDPKYAPVCINPQQRRSVVRGDATIEARHRAEQLLGPGVKFFADSRVQTMKK